MRRADSFFSKGLNEHYGCLEIYQDPYLIEKKERTIKRTWRERLFGRPWNPFRKTRIEYYEEPMKDILRVKHPSGDRYVYFAHPETYKRLLCQIDDVS